MPKTYDGERISISFDMKRCIHARNCFLKLPQVFDPGRRPWVDPDAAPAEEIAAMIRTCPSGALTFSRPEANETPPGINRLSLSENGPNALHGHLKIGEEEMTRATLCRCGQSKNMPYCDYSHVEAKFQATGEPAATGKDAPGDNPGEELAIIQHENGPIEARGALEITSGTGHRLHRGTRAFLCRCGASKTKPFCDGSHKEIGFEAPGDG
ncbi:MAG: CDGSH iron-sulfur domain-containing protein [Pseudomonadota bacterium]